MFAKKFVRVESLAFEKAFSLKCESGFPDLYLSSSELFDEESRWYQFHFNNPRTNELTLEVNVHFSAGPNWLLNKESVYKIIDSGLTAPAIIYRCFE